MTRRHSRKPRPLSSHVIKPRRILVVAAHPDDEMLGLEGSLIKHRLAGDTVEYKIMGKGRTDLDDQKYDRLPLHYWIQRVEELGTNWDVVYTHWNRDRNKDHRIISEAVTTALRPWVFQGTILMFETPDGSFGFNPNWFVDISDVIDKKLSNIKESYPQELKAYPHPRSLKGIDNLASTRGMQSGFGWAEGFELYRHSTTR